MKNKLLEMRAVLSFLYFLRSDTFFTVCLSLSKQSNNKIFFSEFGKRFSAFYAQ